MAEPAGCRVMPEINAARLVRLLDRAVACYSPSYAEAGVAEVFERALRRGGVPVVRQPVPGRGGRPQRVNLVAHLGPQPPALLWVGHLDTVPLQDGEELGPHRTGDCMSGLGTADMKGGCAAAVEALVTLAASGRQLQRGVAVALVVGEEEYGDGAEALAASLLAPLVVVGEPTGLIPCLAHAGYLEGVMEAQGRRAHAALPAVGASATHALVDWWQEAVSALAGQEPAAGVTVNLREIRGGAPLFQVAERCRAVVDIHLPPHFPPPAAERTIEQASRRVNRHHREVQLHWTTRFASAGYQGSREDPRLAPVWDALAGCSLAATPGTFLSHSDAPLFARAGSAVVVCGPGRLEVAHTPEEHVSLQEVAAAARLYAALMAACATNS